jgi:hypothetical protein
VFGEKTISGTYYGSVRPDIDFPILADLDMDKKLNLDDLISRTCRSTTRRFCKPKPTPRMRPLRANLPARYCA